MTFLSKDEKFLRVGEVAELVGVDRTTIYRWVQKGHFPPPLMFGLGKRWRLTVIKEWISNLPYVDQDDK